MILSVLLLALFIGVFASAQTPTYTHSTKVKIETVDEELTPASNTQVLVRDNVTNELKYVESINLVIPEPGLQEVTDIGATTTNNISIDNGSDNGTITLGTTNTTSISWDDFPANGDFTIINGILPEGFSAETIGFQDPK